MMLFFRNDYGNGAHPAVMEALCKTNLELTVGYGMDDYPPFIRKCTTLSGKEGMNNASCQNVR